MFVAGGGNVLNVQRTVRQLIAAGCKGCFLEDQEWPKRPGHIRGNEVISMDEHAAKVFWHVFSRSCSAISLDLLEQKMLCYTNHIPFSYPYQI